MSERTKKSLMGIIATVLAVGTVVFNSGMLASRVTASENEIRAIKADAKMDKEIMSEVRVSVSAINAKLDMLLERKEK